MLSGTIERNHDFQAVLLHLSNQLLEVLLPFVVVALLLQRLQIKLAGPSTARIQFRFLRETGWLRGRSWMGKPFPQKTN